MPCTRAIPSFAAATFALVAAGCTGEVLVPAQSSEGTSGGTGGAERPATAAASASTGAGGSGGAPIDTVAFSGFILGGHDQVGLVGATVCAFDQPSLPCVAAGDQGAFTIALPSNAETAITVVSDGWTSRLLALTTGSTDQSGYAIALPEALSTHDYYVAGGATYPDGGGFLRVDMIGFKLAGVQVSIAPASGVGPLYADTNFDPLPDPTLQATSTGGQARFGDMNAGVVEVAIGGAFSCKVGFGGWPTADPFIVRMPIAAGFETRSELFCK